MAPRIRVLVVDDSAFARKVVREVLAAKADIEVVDIARDGLDALEKIATLRPDVVTLDLEMPNLDGLGVLRALPPDPPRVVVVSTHDGQSALGLAALEAGAVDVVQKPTLVASDRLYGLGDALVAAVRAAAGARRPGPLATGRLAAVVAPRPSGRTILVVGASTGGPQALTQLVRALPADLPVPVAIALHIPPGYTEAFARRLDGQSAVEVVEVHDGLVLRPGLVVVARAGLHLKIRREGQALLARLDLFPADKPHRPSIDVLFQSAAEVLGSGVLAVVLTGMGDDGTLGARAVRGAGGDVLTESESSCVVYGMPRSVVDAGLSSAAAPLDALPALISQFL